MTAAEIQSLVQGNKGAADSTAHCSQLPGKAHRPGLPLPLLATSTSYKELQCPVQTKVGAPSPKAIKNFKKVTAEHQAKPGAFWVWDPVHRVDAHET